MADFSIMDKGSLKYEGDLHGIPVYSSPEVEEDKIYFIDEQHLFSIDESPAYTKIVKRIDGIYRR